MKKRKYTDEQYIDFEYFQDDDEVKGVGQKIVVTRKEHECSSIFSDPHPISVGTRAICENAIHVDDGRVRNYICLDCADEYLDEAFGD
ncbi:MAG: hypothetical protein M3209_09600 [Acidobacteriota bacterium]|nr:hypothetical protein [Acidobacteriota bacterium]